MVGCTRCRRIDYMRFFLFFPLAAHFAHSPHASSDKICKIFHQISMAGDIFMCIAAIDITNGEQKAWLPPMSCRAAERSENTNSPFISGLRICKYARRVHDAKKVPPFVQTTVRRSLCDGTFRHAFSWNVPEHMVAQRAGRE